MSERRVLGQGAQRGRSFLGLGPLEVEVLALLWDGDAEGVTVRDLYEQLRAQRPIAYTTVVSELLSLTRKGLLDCDSSDTAYRYRAAVPPQLVRGAVLDEIVRVLYRGRAAPAAAHLLGLASLDEAQLAELRGVAGRL